MATEALHVPEEDLEDVIKVIEAGLSQKDLGIRRRVVRGLLKWCKEERAYLRRLRDGD